MTVLVRIGDIAQAQHLKVFPSGDRNPNNLVRMEVYKGVIEANFYNGGELQRERFISLLPVDAQARIHSYQTTDILDRAVLVTPTTFQDDSGANVIAIDRVSLDIREQDFKGQQPNQNAFVLMVEVGAERAHLISLTYHVTVLTPTGRMEPGVLPLDVDETVDPNSV